MAANPFIPTWLHRTVTVAHFINCLIVAATLIGYAIVEGGGIGIQFFLGCYQLVVAVLITIAYWQWKIPTIWKLLKMYWLLVLTWLTWAGIMGLVMRNYDSVPTDTPIWYVIIATIIVLPLLIAIYFVYVTHRIYSDFNQP